MLVDTPTPDIIEKIVRDGLQTEINDIVNEETNLAKEKVAARVQELKHGAIGRILSKFRMTRVESPENWTYTLKFEV
jgi:hypothetical protein